MLFWRDFVSALLKSSIENYVETWTTVMDNVQAHDLESVIITSELYRRPSRTPDHQAENQALTSLAEAMSTAPETVLQRLVEAAMALTRSGSAGISLLEPGGENGAFRWVATAGAWSPYRNGTMPREASPCGEVIAREAVLLMKNPERSFPALLRAVPSISEGLLIPFFIDGVPVGTLWTIKHNADDHFEPEDARIVESLARFASAAQKFVLALRSAQDDQLASHTRLRALTLASTDAFYVMSPDMKVLQALSGGEFIADTTNPRQSWIEDYIPKADQARTLAAIDEAIRTEGNFHLEHRVHQIDGSIGWAVSRAVPIVDVSGRITEWFGAAQDITATKQAEAVLRANEERQAFLLKLSDALRAEPGPKAIANRALQMLMEQLRLDRCYVGIYRLAEDIGEFPYQVHDDRLSPMPGQVRLSDFPDSLQVALDRTLVINDVMAMQGLSGSDKDSFDALGMSALIAATLRKGENNPLWAINAISTGPRVWTRDEVALVEEVAERTWAAIERASAEAALHASEERFASFAASSTDVLWIRRADTMEMEYLSPAFAAVYGLDPNEAMGGVHRWAALIVPDDRDVALGHLAAARLGKAAVHEFRIRRPSDGAFRWIRDHDFPLYDGADVKWIGGIATDVTEAKLSAEHQSVLLAELQHRVRNIMAMLRSMVARSVDGAASAADFSTLITGRLRALARTQALLTRAANVGVELGALVHQELKALADHQSQYVLSGPEIVISPKAAEVLSLAVHELATNALKYGALSTPEGTIKVNFEVLDPDGTPRLRLDWSEHRPATPDWSPPTRKGFGSQLITHRVPYELGGRGEIVIGPEDVHVVIEFPLQPGASILETNAPMLGVVSGGSIDMVGEPSLSGQVVLVLEDDFYLAEDATLALRDAGAEVVGPFANAADAMAVLKGGRITAAVLDLNMGAGPSFEMSRAVRDAGAPFVFVTGYDKDAIPEEFADVVRLEKPVEVRDIVRAIAALARPHASTENGR